MYFFDTSALVKRYIVENGTPWVLDTIQQTEAMGERIHISQLTFAELVSSLARRIREGKAAPDDMETLRMALRKHRHEYRVAGVTYGQIEIAQSLLSRYALRAFDAMQLAAALSFTPSRARLNLPPLIFVCADVRLLTVANSEGLTPLNPDDHA